MENSLGISLFLNEGIRIGGSLKLHPSDFIVKEIDLNKTLSEATDEIHIKPEPKPQENPEFTEETFKLISSELGEELANKVQSLTEKISAGDRESILEIPCPEDKQERFKIHQVLKANTQLASSTEVSKGVIKIYSKNLAQSFNKRQKLGLDSRGAKQREALFIKFLLTKENFDTMKAIKIISKATGIKEKSFGIAGIKDKCAVTTQNVTVFSNYLEKLQSAALPGGIRLSNFQYTDQSLKIGDLHGNFFKIIIRNSKITDFENFENLTENLKKKGFVNYFGTQRFGNSKSNPTHLIGLSILQKNYESAVNMILAPRCCKNQEEFKARENWQNFKDVSRSLSEFPPFCNIEKTILSGMQNAGGGKAYLNGIMALARNSRLLYGHAYQSFIWNNAATRRLEISQKTCDLIMDSQMHVAYLDSENYLKYDITDVVLPLPGSKILLPKSMPGCYEELLAKDGVSLDSFKESLKEFGLVGSYRKLVVRPEDLKFRLLDCEEDKKAVEIEFVLPASSYATVLLREIIGEDLETEENNLEIS